jgi:hypothetical protein
VDCTRTGALRPAGGETGVGGLKGGRWGSFGGPRCAIALSQFRAIDAAVVGLAIDVAETFSYDSSRLTVSASLLSWSTE